MAGRPLEDQRLAEMARQAAAGSYSPYSRFRVGAVVVADDGRVFTGANVENASYPVSSCAEATTIAHAVSHGVRKIDTVAVACIDTDDVEQSYPCGRCRQMMAEFHVGRIVVAARSGETRAHTLDELLPHHFTLAQPET